MGNEISPPLYALFEIFEVTSLKILLTTKKKYYLKLNTSNSTCWIFNLYLSYFVSIVYSWQCLYKCLIWFSEIWKQDLIIIILFTENCPETTFLSPIFVFGCFFKIFFDFRLSTMKSYYMKKLNFRYGLLTLALSFLLNWVKLTPSILVATVRGYLDFKIQKTTRV